MSRGAPATGAEQPLRGALVLFTLAVIVVTLGKESPPLTAASGWDLLSPPRVAYVPPYAFASPPGARLVWAAGLSRHRLMIVFRLAAMTRALAPIHSARKYPGGPPQGGGGSAPCPVASLPYTSAIYTLPYVLLDTEIPTKRPPMASYDVIIIGSGPGGGYVLRASAAASLGPQDCPPSEGGAPLGGTSCPPTIGCIPSKARFLSRESPPHASLRPTRTFDVAMGLHGHEAQGRLEEEARLQGRRHRPRTPRASSFSSKKTKIDWL